MPTPTPARSGSLAYGVDGDIYVAEWDGSNPVKIADGRPLNECGGQGEYSGGVHLVARRSVPRLSAYGL